MAAIFEQTDQSVEHFASELAVHGGQPSGLSELRAMALEHFRAVGFPTRRDERWKYTSVAPIARTPFAVAPPATVSREVVSPWLDGSLRTLVFLDGRFAPEHSDAPAFEGLTITPLASAISSGRADLTDHLGTAARYDSSAFTALNTAAFTDGALIELADGTVVENPIQVLFLSSTGDRPTASFPRVVIVCGPHSHLRIVETFAGNGAGQYLTVPVTEIFLRENATIDHYRVQQESVAAQHVGSIHVHQERHSRLTSHSLSLGGALVRTDIETVLDGEGSSCTLEGLYVVGGSQHVDHHTTIDHAKPHTDSLELYKGILDDHSRAIFDGRIIVRKDAQKINSGQVNKNLLLSGDAIVDSKPQLEIFADDVKCTHGSTIGQIDQDAMFYLRSRGIPETEARNMLTFAFASELVQRIRIPSVREQLESVLLERIPRSDHSGERS